MLLVIVMFNFFKLYPYSIKMCPERRETTDFNTDPMFAFKMYLICALK